MRPRVIGIGPVISGKKGSDDAFHVDTLHADGRVWRISWARQAHIARSHLKRSVQIQRQRLMQECRELGPVIVLQDQASFDALVQITADGQPNALCQTHVPNSPQPRSAPTISISNVSAPSRNGTASAASAHLISNSPPRI